MFDQTSDVNGRMAYKLLAKLDENASLIKQAASSVSMDALVGKDASKGCNHFAFPVKRLFPCHTKAATAISALFFEEQKNDMPQLYASTIEANLAKYASYHDIEDTVKSIKQAFLKTEKQADAIDYALKVEVNGKTECYYPLRNPTEIIKAAEYLYDHCDSFDFKSRRSMADNIKAKAMTSGVSLSATLSEYLEKQSGVGYCDPDEVAEMLWQRTQLLSVGPDKDYEIMEKLAVVAKTLLATDYSMTKNDALELAEVIDQIDTDMGFKTKYGSELHRPEHVLFKLSNTDMAKFANDLCQIGPSNVYRKEELEKISLSDVRDVLGDDFADAVTNDAIFVDGHKLAEVLPTMPKPDVELFEAICMNHGIKPCIKEASYTNFSANKDSLEALAKQYFDKHRASSQVGV